VSQIFEDQKSARWAPGGEDRRREEAEEITVTTKKIGWWI